MLAPVAIPDAAVDIPLTNCERCALVDAEDAERVLGRHWYLRQVPAERPSIVTNIACTTVQLHRFVMDAGRDDAVWHENGDTLDCRRPNMRLVTRSEYIRLLAQHAVDRGIVHPTVHHDRSLYPLPPGFPDALREAIAHAVHACAPGRLLSPKSPPGQLGERHRVGRRHALFLAAEQLIPRAEIRGWFSATDAEIDAARTWILGRTNRARHAAQLGWACQVRQSYRPAKVDTIANLAHEDWLPHAERLRAEIVAAERARIEARKVERENDAIWADYERYRNRRRKWVGRIGGKTASGKPVESHLSEKDYDTMAGRAGQPVGNRASAAVATGMSEYSLGLCVDVAAHVEMRLDMERGVALLPLDEQRALTARRVGVDLDDSTVFVRARERLRTYLDTGSMPSDPGWTPAALQAGPLSVAHRQRQAEIRDGLAVARAATRKASRESAPARQPQPAVRRPPPSDMPLPVKSAASLRHMRRLDATPSNPTRKRAVNAVSKHPDPGTSAGRRQRQRKRRRR